MKKTIKTYEGWGKHKGNLYDYLQVGDLVDEEMVNYFIDVLPPATMNHHIIQIGEPYDHINGRGTYSTLKYTPEGWMYCGHCFRGETEEPTE